MERWSIVSDLATAFGVWRMFVGATVMMGSIVMDDVDVVVGWREATAECVSRRRIGSEAMSAM